MLITMREVRWERVVGALVAVAAAAYVFVELRPELLFRDTTPNGGDTGAHVWWPAFMRDHVFPNLRLSGWTPDWYAGFPVGHFYFPIPALLIVGLDLLMPYNVAFKVVTAIGPVLLPISAWFFGSRLRVPWPGPALMAVATLPFLYFTGYTIYGGNLPSTLAGEFSFAIALAMTLFFLGTLAQALDERRRLWLPAVLLGLVVMTHLIAALFAAVTAVVVWLFRRPVRNLAPAAAVAGVAFLVSAVWSLPMVVRLPYATDMGWGKLTEYREHLVHDDLQWAILLAGVALVAGAAYLRRPILELATVTGLFAVAFVVWPEGRLWNARLLPFYYLPLLFLAAAGVAEVVNLGRTALESPRTARWLARRGADETGGALGPRGGGEPPTQPAEPAGPGVPGVAVGSTPGATPDATPGADRRETVARRLRSIGAGLTVAVVAAALVGGMVHARATRDFIPGWIRWNNEGYEAKDAHPEYQAIMDTLDALAVAPGQRLLWERLDRINDYGSDLALELIPYFTDGKIGSMEGLYFESSATTSYHFMTVAELASQPSNPVRGLPYGTIHDDFDKGVEHLQMMGVRFFLAGSDLAKEKASEHEDLRLVEEIGLPDRDPYVADWNLYEVVGARVVEPLGFEPAVLTGVAAGDWREPAVAWWDDPSQFRRPLASGGPASWSRVTAGDAASAPFRALSEVEVTDVDVGVDRVSFRVSEPGVPVLVKVSYFPNWKVEGAKGPWRVTPNFMVVVPTDERVELVYGSTPVDRGATVLTLLGLVGVVALARWRLRPLPPRGEGAGIDPPAGGEPPAPPGEAVPTGSVPGGGGVTS